MNQKTRASLLVVAGIFCLPTAAMAQHSGTDLLALDAGNLKSEVQMRYDAGLAATLDDSTVMMNDSRFLWASETKVQCGIALGYLKSSTRDETSISKCDKAYAMLVEPVAAPLPPPPPPPPAPAVCDDQISGIVFFEFDSSDVQPDARATLEFISTNFAPCGWSSLMLVGYTDRAGSNAYNDVLSLKRARSVEAIFRQLGIDAPITVEARGETEPRVPTADNVREPQNRRVEISGQK